MFVLTHSSSPIMNINFLHTPTLFDPLNATVINALSFVFGLLYDLYSITGDKYEWYKLLPWFVGLFFIVISVGILFGPLKKALSEFDAQQREDGVVVN